MINKCPNISSPQAKEVISKVGLVEFYKLYRENGEEIPDPSTVQPSLGNVDFSLKVINALQNPKTISLYNKFYKNNPTKFYGELQLLGTPKEQLNMLKEFNASNPTSTLDEMISGIGAQFLYPVEIETTIEEGGNEKYVQNEDGSLDFEQTYMTDASPTSYYSNLTVSGGTNYRENEIKTPFITPSIKGHAQFATTSGIGWFRSDDKMPDYTDAKNTSNGKDALIQRGDKWVVSNSQIGDIEIFDSKKEADAFMGYNTPIVVEPKTRRILELQSDLFQKGRDRTRLNSPTKSSVDNFTSNNGKTYTIEAINKDGGDVYGPSDIKYRVYDSSIYNGGNAGLLSKDQVPDDLKKLLSLESPDNQFLQLLNKDGNWINFFIKSIVNDSIKRGYEEVWFPSGDTSVKIESESLYKSIIDAQRRENDDLANTGRFYENRVKNSLNKIYSAIEITDEYGNTWNKVDLKTVKTGTIYLQQGSSEGVSNNPPSSLKGNENESTPSLKIVKDFLSRVGVDIQGVNKITIDGKIIGANGVAFPMQKLVQVVYGKENEALPEEAMHIAVELLEQKNPSLFKEMLNSIGNFEIYRTTFVSYSKNPFYQQNGRPDIRKIKKEAIGKLLAATLDQRSFEIEERKAQGQKWLTKLLEWLKSLFNKSEFNPFVTFTNSIIEGKEDLTNQTFYQLDKLLDIWGNKVSAKKMIEVADSELNKQLVQYLKRYNIDIQQIENLKDRIGVDAVGVVDLLNKIILIDKDKQTIDTLPEEAAHVITMLMKSNPDMKWMLDNINAWEGYRDVYNDYFDQYSGDIARIKFEAVGKFIALHIINNAPTVSNNIKKGILDRITKFITQLFSNKEDFNRLYDIAESISLKVLNNESLIETAIPSNFEQVDTEKAFRQDYAALRIHEKIKDKVLLTGSAAIATQGTIYRNEDNLLHDLDYVVPDSTNIEELIKTEFPNAVSAHDGIFNKDYTTKAWLIPPAGMVLSNIKRTNGDVGLVIGYTLSDKKGKMVGEYEAVVEGKKLISERLEGIKALGVDFFIGTKDHSSTVKKGFSNWNTIFQAKLNFARDKDIRDWVNFKTGYPLEVFNNKETYFQLSPSNQAVTQAWDTIMEANRNLALKDQDAEDRHYEYKGERIEQSVTEKVKSKLGTQFPKEKTAYEKMLENEYKKWGSNGHADIDHLISINIDDNGFLLSTPQDDLGYTSLLDPKNKALYNQLGEYIREKLETYPPGTRFIKEVKGWNGKTGKSSLAGTLDFIALIPDAELGVKVDILDWKFKSLDTERFDDIPWYSIREWNAQMDEYKKFLQGYGIKTEQFRNTRMIPIIIDYKDNNPKDRMAGKTPTSIQLGDNNVKIEGKSYLLPVPTESEIIENTAISNLTAKLRGLYKKLSKKEVEENRKDIKARELNTLFSAIRQLQVRGNLAPIVEQAETINASVKRLLEKYKELPDSSTMSQKDINDISLSIGDAIDNLSIYTSLYSEMDDVFVGELTKEEEDLRAAIAKVTSDASILLLQVKKLDAQTLQKYVVEGRVDGDISKPEVRRNLTQRNLVSLSGQGTVALQTLSRISEEIAFKTIVNRDAERKIIVEKEKKYLEWAKSQGFTKREDIFSPLMDVKKHRLIDEVDGAFYKELRKAIDAKDTKWLTENINMDEYKKRIQELKAREIRNIDDAVYGGSEEDQNARKKKEKSRIDKKYDLKGTGLFIAKELRNFVKKEKWYSEKYKYLQVHPVAMETYNYFRERNNWMRDIGYITEFEEGKRIANARTFSPFVRKGWLEGMQTGTNVSYVQRFIEQFSVMEDDTAYGEKDPQTGKVVNKVPKYLTRDTAPNLLDSKGESVRDENGKIVKDYTDYSTDLFQMYDAINNFAFRWQYTIEREQQVLQMQRMEDSKPSLKTSNFSRIQLIEGRSGNDIKDFEIDPSNEINAKLLKDMTQAIIYGHRYVDNEDVALGDMGKLQKVGHAFGSAINKVLGKDQVEEKEFQERKMSLNKTVDTINRSFRLKTLGFNFLTGGINFLGGNTQVLINAGKYFRRREFIENGAKLLAKNFGTEEGKKMSALVKFFSPLLDDVNRRNNKKLSVSSLDKFDLADTMLSLQTGGDEWIQYNITLSMLENAALIGGKIVNIREYIRNSSEFAVRYKQGVTQKERNDLEATFETKVEEMKKNNLLSLAEFKDGEITIPGIERDSIALFEYRRKIQQISKDATGSMSDDDRRGLNLSVFGSSFMMFKNWIPRLFEVRIASLSQHGDSYEWGRMRMMGKILLQETKFSISTLHSMYKGTEKGVDFMRKLYEKKKEDYRMTTGKELNISEAEFFDMMRQNIAAQTRDVAFLFSLLGMVLASMAFAPDDDEDKNITNAYKFYLRATDKLTDEISFYYSPLSMQQILNGSVFPSLGVLTSATRLTGAIATELFGITLGDSRISIGSLEFDGEEIREGAHPIKYAMKTFRIANQMVNYLPIFYPDVAKDLGIQVQTESRSR